MLKNRIKELRDAAEISQAKLGAVLNLTQQAIAKWEKGIAEPDSENIGRLADYFNVTTDYLLGKSNTPGLQTPAHPTKPPSIEEMLKSVGVKDEEMIVAFKKLIIQQVMIENNESLSKEFDTSGYIAKLGG